MSAWARRALGGALVAGLGGALSTAPSARTASAPSAVRFGVVADVQYADCEDGYNFKRTTVRKFRGALAMLERAVDFWNAEEGLACVVNLGDVIDGRCSKAGMSERCLGHVTAVLDRCGPRVVSLIGNHELYNFGREALHAALGTKGPEGVEYYSLRFPGPPTRLVVLDPYQVSVMSDAPGAREAALAKLREHNPNDVEADGDWFKGLPATHRNFVPYNGALGADQLAWLDAELAVADRLGERAVLLTHTPLHPGACEGTTMALDHEEALAVVRRHPCVVAVLAGHDHSGGYHRDRGVHHVTLQSPLNRGAEGDCYGLVEVGQDALRLRGPELRHLLHPKLAAEHAGRGDEALACVELPFTEGAVGADAAAGRRQAQRGVSESGRAAAGGQPVGGSRSDAETGGASAAA